MSVHCCACQYFRDRMEASAARTEQHRGVQLDATGSLCYTILASPAVRVMQAQVLSQHFGLIGNQTPGGTVVARQSEANPLG